MSATDTLSISGRAGLNLERITTLGRPAIPKHNGRPIQIGRLAAKRMTSGLDLEHLKEAGFVISEGDKTAQPH